MSEKLSALPSNTSPALTDAVVTVKSPGGTPSDVIVPLTNIGSLINVASTASIPYKFRVYRNAAFNATSTETAIAFDTRVFDTGSNVSVSTGLFTCPLQGYYLFGGRSGISIASGNEILVTLVKAGSASESCDGNRGISTDTQSGLIASTVSAPFFLEVNDTVQLNIYSNSTVAAQAGPTTTYFWGIQLSAT